MKKIAKILSLCMAAVLLLSLTAFAAAAPTTGGIYGVHTEAGCTLTPKTLSGGAIAPATVDIDGTEVTDFYADAEKLDLTYTGSQGMYLVLILTEELAAGAVPTAENIDYIDQATIGAEGTMSLTLVHRSLNKGTYYVYLSSDAGLVKVASYSYYQPYTVGDANDDGSVDVSDAVVILQYIVGNTTLDGSKLLAADANGDGEVDVSDAVAILQYIVGNGTLAGN